MRKDLKRENREKRPQVTNKGEPACSTPSRRCAVCAFLWLLNLRQAQLAVPEKALTQPTLGHYRLPDERS